MYMPNLEPEDAPNEEQAKFNIAARWFHYIHRFFDDYGAMYGWRDSTASIKNPTWRDSGVWAIMEELFFGPRKKPEDSNTDDKGRGWILFNNIRSRKVADSSYSSLGEGDTASADEAKVAGHYLNGCYLKWRALQIDVLVDEKIKWLEGEFKAIAKKEHPESFTGGYLFKYVW